jgi:Protein of unknown function (DUF998)
VSGLAAVVTYLAFTIAAYLSYPGTYGPLRNWLSDLGNPIDNPSGAVFYRLGCGLTAVFLIAFFAGLSGWNTGDRKMRILLITSQTAGALSALALILTAVFPLGTQTDMHRFWSMMLYLLLGFFLTFSATSLLRHPAFARRVAYYGFVTAAFNFVNGAVLTAVIGDVYVGEWISVGMFMIYVLMLANSSRAIDAPVQAA